MIYLGMRPKILNIQIIKRKQLLLRNGSARSLDHINQAA